jgi:hypothetical protein
VVVVLFVVTATQRHGQANDQHQYKHDRTGFAHAADVHLEFRLRVLETAHEVWWRAEAGIRGRRGVVGYHQLPVHLVPLAGGTASSVIVGVHHQLSVHLVPLAGGSVSVGVPAAPNAVCLGRVCETTSSQLRTCLRGCQSQINFGPRLRVAHYMCVNRRSRNSVRRGQHISLKTRIESWSQPRGLVAAMSRWAAVATPAARGA